MFCKDHLGYSYDSISEMCEHYGISYETYRYRKKLGWPLKRILETKLNDRNVYDHLGNKYFTLKDMLEHYKIAETTYYRKKSKGFKLNDILEPKIKAIDYKGNEYPNIRAMVKYYGISVSTYYKRIRMGYTYKELFLGRGKKYRYIRDLELQEYEEEKRNKAET